MAGLLICNVGLKNIVARPRPCWLESIDLLVKNPRDYSFPSGHTWSAVAGAWVATAANRRFGYAAIPLAAALAFSRLYLFVHFPSDVLAGLLWARCWAFWRRCKAPPGKPCRCESESAPLRHCRRGGCFQENL